jgi:hypothetical protein
MRALLFVLLVIPLELFAQVEIEGIEPAADQKPKAVMKPSPNMKPSTTIAPVTPIGPVPLTETISDIDFKPSEEISEDFPVALPSDI